MRFVTTERIASDQLEVLKRSRVTEPFSRQKIARSIRKAASGQHLLPGVIDDFVERVVDRLAPEAPGLPIPTSQIGRLVLECLDENTDATDVVRIRFAMVFLGRLGTSSAFRELEDFRDWLGKSYSSTPSVPQPQASSDVWVVKRDGRRELFSKQKLERSVGIAAKGRGNDQIVHALATYVGETVLEDLRYQAIVSSQQIATSVLRQLMRRDKIAYLRYASITKRYENASDFLCEIHALEGQDSERPSG